MKIRVYAAGLILLMLLPVSALAGSAQPALDAEPEMINVGPLSVIPAASGIQLSQPAAVRTERREDTACLYSAPDEHSSVLMTYYSGAPLTALRRAGDFYQVQAGSSGASLMGYMRVQDVAVGDTAERVVSPAYMELQFNREADVFAYCDAGAAIIGRCEPGRTYYAMSKNDEKWVQLYLPPQEHVWEEKERMTRGFVQLKTGMAIGRFHMPGEWTVEPRTGEITRKQAAELAIDHLTRTNDHSLPDVYMQREALEAMDFSAQLRQMEGSMINDWQVYFWEREGSDFVRVYVHADALGNVKTHHQYWPAGEYPYGVRPTL